jgi:hypothetical protein
MKGIPGPDIPISSTSSAVQIVKNRTDHLNATPSVPTAPWTQANPPPTDVEEDEDPVAVINPNPVGLSSFDQNGKYKSVELVFQDRMDRATVNGKRPDPNRVRVAAVKEWILIATIGCVA